MKIFCKIILFMISSVTAWGQTDTTQAIFILNGQIVGLRQLELLDPVNIEKIDVVKSTRPGEVRITTKKITLLSYQDVKVKAGLNESESPTVVVDTKKYEVKDILIDKSLIKRIKLTNNRTVIDIRTKYYKKKRRENKRQQIIIRGQTTAHNNVHIAWRGSMS